MSCYYVYGYFDPRTDECFYVGKGSGTRAWEHFADSSRERGTPFYRRLDSMLESRIIPNVIIISSGLRRSHKGYGWRYAGK